MAGERADYLGHLNDSTTPPGGGLRTSSEDHAHSARPPTPYPPEHATPSVLHVGHWLDDCGVGPE